MFQAFNGVKSLKEVNAEVVAVNEDTHLSREASKVDATEVLECVRVKFEEETKEDVDRTVVIQELNLTMKCRAS